MQFQRLNADRLPDDAEEHELRAGQALVIPAYTFHWVHGGDDGVDRAHVHCEHRVDDA